MRAEIVNRKNTNCAKWDELIEETGEPDIIPLTVADMDFRISDEIIAEIIKCARHGVYGYTNVSKKCMTLVHEWIAKHYSTCVTLDDIVFCPRIINAIALFIQNFTKPGDKILVNTPLYDPIATTIEINNRLLVKSPLVLKNNHYEINFAELEELLKTDVKAMILVSPHNPSGRVFNKSEIQKIVNLCKKNDVLLFSDEVHADFIWKGNFTSVASEFHNYSKIIVGYSPAKTFNIPGIEASFIVIKNNEIRDKFLLSLRQNGFNNPNYFCNAAVEAAYGKSDTWLSEIRQYILDNRQFAVKFITEKMYPCKVVEGEGTFLLWVDYSSLGITEDKLSDKLIHDAKVAFSMGSSFGEDGNGFMRINLALPKELLESVLNKVSVVIEEAKNESKS